MKYKELYKELANHLNNLGCFVCDIDVLGHCRHAYGLKAFIYVKSDLNYKEKYFVLAHEAGHLFSMKKDQKFCWSKNGRSEEEANRFALQLLGFNEIDGYEYRKFYNKAKKKFKKRKKSWFEI